MKSISLGFIGGGRITRIFLQAFANEKKEFDTVVVFDPDTNVLLELKKQFPDIIIAENIEMAARQRIVFFAIHPPVIMEMLDKLTYLMEEDTIVISLAPKITIAKIASKINIRNIVRMIPNATSFINEGYNPITFNNEMRKSERDKVSKLLKILGKTFECDESKLEAYAIVSAMLPTYFWFQWQAVQEVAEQLGLTEKEAHKTIKSTLKRAIDLYFDSGLTPSEVMNLVPVKPIGENQKDITEIYHTKLTGLYEKIKP